MRRAGQGRIDSASLCDYSILGAQNTFRKRPTPERIVVPSQESFVISCVVSMGKPPGVDEIQNLKGEIVRCLAAVLSTRSLHMQAPIKKTARGVLSRCNPRPFPIPTAAVPFPAARCARLLRLPPHQTCFHIPRVKSAVTASPPWRYAASGNCLKRNRLRI